jgi:ABC-type molybdenum transport system ATPase subunit/photorepair protein PhrA
MKPFLKRITTSKVEIQIDEKERKHLILTGKNGSGKTSAL